MRWRNLSDKSKQMCLYLMAFLLLLSAICRHTPFEWTLIYKYATRDITTTEKVVIDESRIEVIGYPDNHLTKFPDYFIKFEEKYYLIDFMGHRAYLDCADKKCNRIIYKCRGDICLLRERTAGYDFSSIMFIFLFLIGVFSYYRYVDPIWGGRKRSALLDMLNPSH